MTCGPLALLPHSRYESSAASARNCSMEMEAKSHIKKITDLRRDAVEMLCKYLSAVGMVNVCTAIPSWEWILFLLAPYSYTNKWKWIDKRVCTTLQSDLRIPPSSKICRAVEQHFNQMLFDHQFSLIRAPHGDRRDIFTELEAILKTLSPKHTFGVVIIDDVRRKEEVGMDLFMDYAKKLGFVYNSPRMSPPINWRIWHVQDTGGHITNRRDTFEWVCQDVIWRRMQESVI
ncbi:hypothetical protein TSMEX_002657 [Taenia solium]|eukprot:TsM_001077000 transcript=TsM_001077000 gene=TsM_001077000